MGPNPFYPGTNIFMWHGVWAAHVATLAVGTQNHARVTHHAEPNHGPRELATADGPIILKFWSHKTETSQLQ